jgi:hypothetical protein
MAIVFRNLETGIVTGKAGEFYKAPLQLTTTPGIRFAQFRCYIGLPMHHNGATVANLSVGNFLLYNPGSVV